MRKILFIFTICLVYSFSSICLAYPNEKNGFRNFYWGESLQEVQADSDKETFSFDCNMLNFHANNSLLV